MNPDPKDTFEKIDPQAGVDKLMTGVLEIATATLGISATLAKTLAQETAKGNSIPEPEGRESPLNTTVHYGIATVTNVLKLVIASVPVPTNIPTEQQSESTRSANSSSKNDTRNSQNASHPGLPTVHPGSLLRIPLSIENPGVEPMNDMMIYCESLEALVEEDRGQKLDSNAIRFQPETLSIAPKDFEKLTVFVTTHIETTVGDYTAIIKIGSDNFETILKFRVLAAN
jgi:hypothetical protein